MSKKKKHTPTRNIDKKCVRCGVIMGEHKRCRKCKVLIHKNNKGTYGRCRLCSPTPCPEGLCDGSGFYDAYLDSQRPDELTENIKCLCQIKQ